MTLSIDPLVLEDLTSLIMSQFVQLSRKLLFRPPLGSVSFEAGLLWRIDHSDFTRWSMYLSARVLKEISNGINGQKYIGWIFRFYQRIIESATSTESTKAMEGRLGGLHDMTYLGFTVSGIAFGYSLFQRSAPTFLRLAALDPDLWSDNSTILISKAIGSRYEVSRFVAHDTLIAFILGVSPLLRYNTSTPWSDEQPNRIIELIYGIPTEVLCHLAKINAWRTSWLMGEMVQSQNGWRDMEGLLKNGDSAIDHTDDPTNNIARFTVRETWRQVTLIYLYMGARGVNSADPRVEAAVQQVVQLGNTVKPGSALELHTLIPCVIAGVAARREKHRASLRTKITSQSRCGVTLVLRTSEFAAVLDHLWHGAGAGGKPTTWGDYVHSRCAVLPIAC
ncbi:fungal-specific transcription factor domain protein [Rhizoctonia solani 123E]|uniref:Fungal-specific transcription factor domain protein n=1 Tax=Rhizoctonia solani 123E TaxID=1423351 RepID=A0A074RJV0_9AGAM|nr:fungal-specific transcription factor domain protein [Rhizoctonia solani 123E]